MLYPVARRLTKCKYLFTKISKSSTLVNSNKCSCNNINAITIRKQRRGYPKREKNRFPVRSYVGSLIINIRFAPLLSWTWKNDSYTVGLRVCMGRE